MLVPMVLSWDTMPSWGGSSGGGVDYGSYRWLSVVGLIPEDKLEGTRVQ